MQLAPAPYLEVCRNSKPTRIGATWSCFMNIFTAIPEKDWGRAIRPGGLDWSRSCCSRVASCEKSLESLVGFQTAVTNRGAKQTSQKLDDPLQQGNLHRLGICPLTRVA